MIIDLDSHLREGYFMDEVYKLGEPFAQFTPRKANDEGRSHRIFMATDYPHFDSEYPHTVSGIEPRTDITDSQKARILGENAVELLNL